MGATGLDDADDKLSPVSETKRKGQLGPLYKGHEGQYSWLLHRVTGLAIILFLFAHVVDTAVVGWGPDAYNRVASVYHNPFIRMLELGLVAAVLYHSFNGVKIMLIDFFPGLTRHIRALGIATTLLFVGSMIPITWIMGSAIVELLLEG
jgi:succinate dehydrogenase / fumarate reductase cytochrome b subunit